MLCTSRYREGPPRQTQRALEARSAPRSARRASSLRTPARYDATLELKEEMGACHSTENQVPAKIYVRGAHCCTGGWVNDRWYHAGTKNGRPYWKRAGNPKDLLYWDGGRWGIFAPEPDYKCFYQHLSDEALPPCTGWQAGEFAYFGGNVTTSMPQLRHGPRPRFMGGASSPPAPPAQSPPPAQPPPPEPDFEMVKVLETQLGLHGTASEVIGEAATQLGVVADGLPLREVAQACLTILDEHAPPQADVDARNSH